VTLIAQDCDDMFAQFELEREASRMMVKAVAQGKRNGNTLVAA